MSVKVPGAQLAFQFFMKWFSGVEVRAVFRHLSLSPPTVVNKNKKHVFMLAICAGALSVLGTASSKKIVQHTKTFTSLASQVLTIFWPYNVPHGLKLCAQLTVGKEF